jgi:hypothetical protein
VPISPIAPPVQAPEEIPAEDAPPEEEDDTGTLPP